MYLELVVLGIILLVVLFGIVGISIRERMRDKRSRYIARMRNRLLRFGR